MNDVGQILKKNRLSKNLTINKVSEDLKISRDIIEKLENNKIKKNPDLVFTLGHLRVYCNYLDLETSEIIKNFKNQISFNKKKIGNSIPKPFNLNDQLKLFNFIPALLLVVIFSTFYLLFIKQTSNQIDYALVPDLPENFEPIIEELEIQNLKNNLTKASNKTKENKDDFSITGANASTKVDNDFQSKTVTIRLLGSTWLQLRDQSDNIILSKLMEKDEEYTYNIDLNYNITAGNAGNLLVIIDDKVRGKIGKYGQVLDSFILDKNFNN